MISQNLRTLLGECTVKVLLRNGVQGTGFFVAPTLILTCAHVVREIQDTSTVDIIWKELNYKAQLESILCRDSIQLDQDRSLDLAILRLIGDNISHPCVEFDSSIPKLGTKMLTYSYSGGDSGENTFEYEGNGFKKDALLQTLKMGVAVPGMSGSPLLNCSTGRVCGILVLSSDMGGKAIPTATIKSKFPDVLSQNYKFHRKDRRWYYLRLEPIRLCKRKFYFFLISISSLLILFFHFFPPNDQFYLNIAKCFTTFFLTFSLLMIAEDIAFVLRLEKLFQMEIILYFLSCISVWISWNFAGVLVQSDGYIHNGKTSSQYFTGLDVLPVLSFVQSEFSDELTKTVLNTSINPLIYRKSPVFPSLEKFVFESGNSDYLKNMRNLSASYKFNKNGYTKSATLAKEKHETLKVESQEEFEDSTRMALGNEFSYVDLVTTFKENLENAEWTSFIDSTKDDQNRGVGKVVQFPKLSSLLDPAIKISPPDWRKNVINDVWIKNIALNNPSVRGFVGLIYNYVTDPKNPSIKSSISCGDVTPTPIEGIPLTLVEKSVRTPYVRFADIMNSSKTDVRISAISYAIHGDLDHPYQLTDVSSNRSALFNNKNLMTENLDPSGINLLPGQHFLLPIEFGFDSRSQRDNFRTEKPTSKSEILRLASQDVYISKADARLIDYKKSNVLGIVNKLDSSSGFLRQSKTLSELFQSVPKRFALGVILNLNSVTIDGETISLKPPLNDPFQIAASKNYQYGSCPYLLVKNKNTGRWRDLGTVLTGRSNSALQYNETHYLGDEIDTVRLEEREREVTYLDSFTVNYYDPTSQKILQVVPELPDAARKTDNKYYLMNTGDFIEIDLKKLLPSNAQKIHIEVSGYYLPSPKAN